MFTFEELAELFGVQLRTIYAWRRAGLFDVVVRRTGRFSVKVLVMPDEALRLFKLKFATPGDGSETSRIYEERVRRRRVAGLAAAAKRWGKLKEHSKS
jgi:phage terminase Nu1 subunit (DNA packaging protein)